MVKEKRRAKQALEQAQTLAAQWKEEPATGLLRNLSTGETMNPGEGGMAILDAPSAAVIGKQPGDKVPMKIALQAKQFVDAGVKTMQANGRSLLVDSSGKTIVDKGAATPVVVNNLQNAGATGTPGQPGPIAKGLADGSMKWSDVVSARTPMSVKQAILAEVKSIKPDFNSGDYEVEQKVKQQATSGSRAPSTIPRARVPPTITLVRPSSTRGRRRNRSEIPRGRQIPAAGTQCN